MNHEDVKVLPLALYGAAKGVVEEYVAPTYEKYKPVTVQEKIETAGLVVAIGTVLLAGYAIYDGFKNESA